MPDSWTICVSGRRFGPYSDEEMRSFAAEGRLARQSLVAQSGATEYRKAAEIPELADIFAPPPVPQDAPAHGQRRDGAAIFGRNDSQPGNAERAHIVVIADMKSRSIAKLEEEIATLGPTVAILPQVWLLSTDVSVNTVRNLLVQQLGKLDMLFVVDASNNKAAWFNFGPEADARIRKIWRGEAKLLAAS